MIPPSAAGEPEAVPDRGHVLAVSNRVFALLVLLIIAGAIVRSAIATRLDSWTQDEGYHIVAGVSYIQRGDFRINPEHPPLVKLWVGSIISATGFALSPFRPIHDKTDERDFVDEETFLHNDPQLVQHRARIAMWVFNAILLAGFAFALRVVFGPLAALGVLLILAVDPTVAAHLPLVLTDLPVSLLSATAIVLGIQAFRYWRWSHLTGCCVALGLALATKHSAPVFAILLSVAGVVLLFVAPLQGRRDTRSSRLVKLCLVFVGAVLILWSSYRFRFTESPAAQEVFNRPLADKIADLHSPFRRIVLAKIAQAHLLPRPYIWGLADTIRGGIEGRLEARLFYGRLYFGNPPRYFFPGILAAKLPLGASFLILLGLFLLLASRLPTDWNVPILVLSGVAAGFFLVLASGATYGGIRHALPAEVLISIFGGFSIHAAFVTDSKLLRSAVALAFLAAIVSAVPVLRPYEYYNELIGMRNADLYFNDEGLEGEQRRAELAQYYLQKIRPSGEIPYLMYDISTLESKARGLDWIGRDPQRDKARLNNRIVSGTILYAGRFLGRRPFWDSPTLRAATPVARLGNLLVYRGTFDLPGLPASNLYYDSLEKIYAMKPDLLEAERMLRESVQLDPTAFFVHIEIGNLCLARGSREEALHAYNDAFNYAPDLPSFRQPIRDQINQVSTEALSQIPPLRNPELE